jgi:hypothetical protein
MMRKNFCCDASRGMYEDYYMNQSGGGVPVFQGSRGQRGHGLGSMLSGLFRSAMPLLKRGLAVFGKHALKTGAEIATDVSEGQSLRDAAKNRIPLGIKRMATSGDFSMQSGTGRRKRSIKRRKKAKINDIFG